MPLIHCIQCNPTGSFADVDPGCPYCNGTGTIQTDPETAAHVATHAAGVTVDVTGMLDAARGPSLARYPVAIAMVDDAVCVVANDGTAWWCNAGADSPTTWHPFDPLPQPEAR